MPSASRPLAAAWVVGRTAVKEAICYPADVVIEFLSYPIAFIGYFYFVQAVLVQGGERGGYSLTDLVTYFSIGWVLRMVFDQGVDDVLAEEVQSGDVALALVRPLSLEHYFFSRFVALGCARLLWYGLPAALLLAGLFGDKIEIAPARLVWFVPYALVAFRMAFEVQYGLGILAFFITMNRQASWSLDMLIRLVSGLVVPLHLFPSAVVSCLELLPFQYLYYRPIQALLEPGEPGPLVAGLAIGVAWVAALRLANRLFLARALRVHVIYGS